MNFLVPTMLFGWIPAVLVLFMILPARQAVLAGFVAGWLFLPVASLDLAGLPAYTKMTAVSVVVLLGIILFDLERLASYRPHWLDVPMIVWCLTDLFTALSNELGVYDGMSGVLGEVMSHGLPYFIGRLYFNDPKSLRQLAVAIFVGGLVYIPFCLFEIRMSPQLHRWVYGFHQHRFSHAMRLGGYRPRVFMNTGLAVGMWMAMTTLVGFWMLRIGGVRRFAGVRMWIFVTGLAVTTILCKSVGAAALMALGMGATLATQWTRSRFALAALVLLPPTYMVLRATQAWSGRDLVRITREHINEDRAMSLEGRLEQEDAFSTHAFKRPLYGWGASGGRFFPRDRFTGEQATRGIDSFWIVMLAVNGLVGLCSWTLAMLLPPAVFVWRNRAEFWRGPIASAPGALALVLCLYVTDCLFNAMVSPLFALTCGSLAGLIACYVPRPASTRVATPAARSGT